MASINLNEIIVFSWKTFKHSGHFLQDNKGKSIHGVRREEKGTSVLQRTNTDEKFIFDYVINFIIYSYRMIYFFSILFIILIIF